MKKLIIAASIAISIAPCAFAEDTKQAPAQPTTVRITTDQGPVVVDMGECFGKPTAEYKAPESSRRSDVVTDAFMTAGDKLKDLAEQAKAKVKSIQQEAKQPQAAPQKHVQVLTDRQAAQLALYRLRQGALATDKQQSASPAR